MCLFIALIVKLFDMLWSLNFNNCCIISNSWASSDLSRSLFQVILILICIFQMKNSEIFGKYVSKISGACGTIDRIGFFFFIVVFGFYGVENSHEWIISAFVTEFISNTRLYSEPTLNKKSFVSEKACLYPKWDRTWVKLFSRLLYDIFLLTTIKNTK